MPSPFDYSKNQINKAGDTIRRYIDDEADEDELDAALEVMESFRGAHYYPLTKATTTLRYFVNSEGCDGKVSQRLKRSGTMIDKLDRQPEMALARMQDVAGCRAILADLNEVRRVEARVRRWREVKHSKDYIAEPAISGYRSVHVVVLYDDVQVEVQLRTEMQHQWAVGVETWSGRTGWDLKSGKGPGEVLEWLAAIGDAYAVLDDGGQLDETTTDRIATLRGVAMPHLEGEAG